ncbi:hypothetical protein PMAYCL1PPCAC_24116 [Pristionchus mayeri]|uniref:Uncharacterized protein n=1 Tax=Pristionchus mayeri TaxID=1317129 RepID=A0AAN5D055_9BILA|nr:hypothetical protein PMAYCL1PPCAC_24116 [Pristionchus mayeri]
MQFILRPSILFSFFSLCILSSSAPIEGDISSKNEVNLSLTKQEDPKKQELPREEKEREDPLVHQEPQREFVPIHKRDTEHKPVAEAEVPSMSSDGNEQPKSPFEGVRDDSEAKVRISRRVGKKKVTPRPSRD